MKLKVNKILAILLFFVLVGCMLMIRTSTMESFKSPYKLDMIDMSNCKPSCCPSTYSCDSGCVCLSDEDKDKIAKRGGNTSFAGEFVIP